MRKLAPVLIPLVLFKFAVHWVGNQNYGFHRDELLHLAASEHLDWGFFEFPPFIALVGNVAHFLFGYSLAGVRLFPTLAGIGMLVICCLMAVQLGGGRKAALLAGVAVLAFIPFYRNHTLFQPVAFDQFFWAAGFFFLIRYINSNDWKDLLLMGLVSGFGLMNKYTMLIWGFGVAIGLLFHDGAAAYKSRWLYLAGLLALVTFSPNIYWQFERGFPVIAHLKELSTSQLSELGAWDFAIGQLELLPTLGISLIGLGALLGSTTLRKYRTIGVAFVVIFTTMWLAKAKPYYFFAAYPVVFAAGAVQIEQWLKKRQAWIYVVAASMLAPALFFIPKMAPILPIDMFTKWYDVPMEDGRPQLTGDYADMFGWEEQVALVDSVYQSLPDSVQRNTVIWAENYGEAGALQILGDRYGLPDPISRHGSFWYWGHGKVDADLWISIGNQPDAVNQAFRDCRLIKTIRHRYAIDEENGIPLYVCRDPRVDIPEWWAAYENAVFE